MAHGFYPKITLLTRICDTRSTLQHVKEKQLPTKLTKFNKYKHEKSKWITKHIFKLWETKDKLYKGLQQLSPNNTEKI